MESEKPARNGPVARVKGRGLLRRQAPSRTEAGVRIPGAEAPERRIPRGAVAGALARRGGDAPSLDDRLQKAVPDEPFAVRAREVGGTDGDDPAVLERPQRVQRAGQLRRRCRYRAGLPSAFRAAPISAYSAGSGGFSLLSDKAVTGWVLKQNLLAAFGHSSLGTEISTCLSPGYSTQIGLIT